MGRYRNRPVPAAYFVDGYQRSRAFIVTERPGAAACDALWRLAWEQGVTTVVLIGVLQGMEEWFLPKLGRVRSFRDLSVRGHTERALVGCVVRETIVSKLKVLKLVGMMIMFVPYQERLLKGRSRRCGERRLQLWQYTDWPELGMPDSPLQLLHFTRRIILKHKQELGVFSYWQHAIGQCPHLLTTLAEYAFLHDCLLERVTAGETLVPRDGARRYLEQLQSSCGTGFPHSTAEKQYNSATDLKVRHFTVSSGNRPCNEGKRRGSSFIQMEDSRVRLAPTFGLDGTDYVNASWLPGYRLAKEYILTQHPPPSTVLSFWQMVWEHRVTTVACLSPEECGVFWPLAQPIYCPQFIIRYVSESADCSATYKTSWIVRSFRMDSAEGAGALTVRLVSLPMWPEEASIDSAMEGVQAVQEVHGERQTPLLVVDRYGGTEGASFCLLGTALRQLQHEACFDVFTYAKLYHQRRPGIWKSMREYLYLYHAVSAWLATRGNGVLYRGASCTSLCESRTPTEATRDAAHGVMV
ncbi:tyrosine-protein phosphatase 99A-like [Pollicipes pollicipes]|uniref:tyrosine-protein phosphatase 99A-like n=1 Tax=Pollicipes pollicipes TaxID=41117 RepID=UPI001884C637|nr:tyrosine-protein phosphatase 99A-like [Pollicipes pollicipes]